MVGLPAPSFKLRDAVNGGEYGLDSFLARGPLILKWIRRPAEAGEIRLCPFPLAFALCHEPFAAVSYYVRHPAAFPVLVDATGDAARAYGVYPAFGLRSPRPARRATFVIGPGGIVRYAHLPRGSDGDALEQALQAARSAAKAA